MKYVLGDGVKIVKDKLTPGKNKKGRHFWRPFTLPPQW